jgi:hypothetical protein
MQLITKLSTMAVWVTSNVPNVHDRQRREQASLIGTLQFVENGCLPGYASAKHEVLSLTIDEAFLENQDEVVSDGFHSNVKLSDRTTLIYVVGIRFSDQAVDNTVKSLFVYGRA